jgi:hypothetical protein
MTFERTDAGEDRLVAAARELPGPTPTAEARARIAERVARGDVVFLPAEESRRSAWAPRAWLAAAAAILVAVVLVVPGRPIMAGASVGTLTFSPGAAQRGAKLEVTYRPSELLASERTLRLRGRLRSSGHQPYYYRAPSLDLGVLERAKDGSFRGRVALPDSVVYATFVVEKQDGSVVDHNSRRLWEVLVNGPDQKPLLSGLEQRLFDHMGRDWDVAYRTALEMAKHHPDEGLSWNYVLAYHRSTFGRAAGDSLRISHKPKFIELSTRLRERTDLTPAQINGMVHYAIAVADTGYRYWIRRLQKEAPRHPWAVFSAASTILERHRTDPAAYDKEAEGLWMSIADTVGPAYHNFLLQARQMAGDGAAAGFEKWSGRYMQYDEVRPEIRTIVYAMMTKWPELRATAVKGLRDVIAELESPTSRDLTETVSSQPIANDELNRRARSELGVALLAQGDTISGIAELERAVSGTWNPALFSKVATVRLKMGDTASALPLIAQIASDPMTKPTTADSLSRIAPTSDWPRLVAAASDTMRQRVLRSSQGGRPAKEMKLVDHRGDTTTIAKESNRRVTVVLLWSRFCSPSQTELSRLDSLSAVVTRAGGIIVPVTQELPSAEVSSFLKGKKIQTQVYHDRWSQVSRSLELGGTPSYVVLDDQGRIRFRSDGVGSFESVIRQVLVLTGQ